MYPKRPRLGLLSQTLQLVKEKWDRDLDLPLGLRLEKAIDYSLGMTTAFWFLRRADTMGRGARTQSKPRIINHGTLIIGRHTVLRSMTTPVELVVNPGAKLTIGEKCQLNYGVSISVSSEITIGDRVQIGPYVMIVDEQFHDVHDRLRRPAPIPVLIESDVWIGAKASVLPGVRVGRGAIIAAHALVNKDVEPFTIVAGVPAKVVGRVDSEKFECPDEPIDPDTIKKLG